jgi:transcriptional regulator with XRE-family HTH domain
MDGKNLKIKMQELGIRQIEMAAELGINDSLLNKILNGWRKPSEALSKKISAYIEKRRERLISKSKMPSDKQI